MMIVLHYCVTRTSSRRRHRHFVEWKVSLMRWNYNSFLTVTNKWYNFCIVPQRCFKTIAFLVYFVGVIHARRRSCGWCELLVGVLISVLTDFEVWIFICKVSKWVIWRIWRKIAHRLKVCNFMCEIVCSFINCSLFGTFGVSIAHQRVS